MESKVFSLEMDEKLIDLVSCNPILYDMNRKNYKDTMVKNNVWKKIAASLNLHVDQCQTRWKTIRDTHRRNLKRLKSKTTTVSSAFSKSKYTNKALQFLVSTFKERPIMTSMTVAKPQTEVGEVQPSCSKNNVVLESQVCEEVHYLSETEVDDDLSLLEDFDENDFSVKKVNEERKPVQPMKKIKKTSKDRMIEEVKGGREERNKILSDLVAAKQNKLQNPVKEHAVDIFFSSMAEVVKTFPPLLIAEARMKVCKLVSELEIRALQQTAHPPVITSGLLNLPTECIRIHTHTNSISSGTSSSSSQYNSPNDLQDEDSDTTLYVTHTFTRL